MSDLHTALLEELQIIDNEATGVGPILRLTGALRAVVELHKPMPSYGGTLLLCDGCEMTGYDAEPPTWPCSTIQAIADQLGLTEGNDHHV